ncbi:GntR family transcriptional regulator [Rhizobium sp. SL86]|uniref:GntR family transcriptional regulator n=1 Tax=Rhizobium sp. SL86 TaxID=2995148 RepID=UPI0022756DF3|nr:GntR family transcriptional regulator [Rhizobium sp. SL86]MCY1667814.1 GntR family transcriptional regulator [Rhizobium sp. SL86]
MTMSARKVAAQSDATLTDFAGAVKHLRSDSSRRQTLKQFAREGILAAILAGKVKPGEKLLQKDLAEGLGISITPVREALNELSAEGFVHLDPHRGAVVRKMSEEEMIETTSILAALIPLSAKLMAENITEAELEHAVALQDELEQITDVTEFVRLNRVFHNFLTNCARAPRLSGIINPLRDSQSVMLNITVRTIDNRLSQANREHRALLAALAARDPEAAMAAMVEHAKPNREAVRKFFGDREKSLD